MTDSNGLYYMRARFYSPEIRRFVNQDILLGFVAEGQTLNRYFYVTGQSVSYVVPFGLSALVGVLPIAGILASDGPLPVGDIIALLIITGAVIYDNVVDSASPCRCNDKKTYYHYTSKANLALILASQQLLLSSGPIHARHGGGQYFTDISPEMIAAATMSGLTAEQIAAGMISLGQLGRIIYGSAVRVGKKLEAFIEINLEGCHVINPIPFIYLVPNAEALNLNSRIIHYGEVILP
jgi:RHS repeat-associated protein